jgi:hypothetical protein
MLVLSCLADARVRARCCRVVLSTPLPLAPKASARRTTWCECACDPRFSVRVGLSDLIHVRARCYSAATCPAGAHIWADHRNQNRDLAVAGGPGSSLTCACVESSVATSRTGAGVVAVKACCQPLDAPRSLGDPLGARGAGCGQGLQEPGVDRLVTVTVTESDPDASEGEMDPTTAITTAKVAAVALEESRGLLQRVLGPAATELGEFLGAWTKIKLRHALRVAERADKRLAAGAVVSGSISSRAAMRIFDEAAYCGDDDEIVVEYLGGLLASSRIRGRHPISATLTPP